MEHDLKSLQVFIEQKFEAIAARDLAREVQAAERDHARDARQASMHSDNLEANRSLTRAVDGLQTEVSLTNGRVRKVEVAVAVLKFAVFTIGGGIVGAVVLVLINRLTHP